MAWRVRSAILLAALAALSLGVPAADVRSGIRTWTAPARSATPPVLDGRLDEPCWGQALVIGDFRRLGTADPAADRTLPATRALIAWDAEALYIGFDCREPLMPALVTTTRDRDGPVWSDDSIEIFLDPAGTRQGFVQIAVNAAGVTMDGIQTHVPGSLDRTWDTGASAATRADPDGWTAEIAIPLWGLPLSAPAAQWTFHLARNRRAAGQHLTALGAVINGFGDVAHFDVLSGIDLPERVVSVGALDLGEGFQGTNLARVTVHNLGAAAAQVTAALAWGDAVPAQPIGQAEALLQPGTEAVLVLPWERAAGKTDGQDRLLCTVSAGPVLLRRSECRLGPVPAAVGEISPRVHLMEPGAPVALAVPIRVAAGSRSALVLEWQAFAAAGELVGQGLTTVHTPAALVRLFWNRWDAGRYTLRFTLRSGEAVLASADTTIRLVKSPWGE